MAVWLSLGAVFIILIMLLVANRGAQLKLLVGDGVDATGTVVRQRRRNPKSHQSTNHYLRYEYTDASGARHEGSLKAAREFWADHPEGATIEIVYSRSKPSVSAARFLVEQAREALAKRKP